MGEVTSEVERQDSARRRNRVVAIASGIVVAVVAVVVVVAVSGGGNDDTKTSSPTPVTARSGNSVELPLGDVSADSAGAPVTVTPEQSQQIISVLHDYVTDAVVQPLRSGAPATADLAAVFDAGTLARATTTDRAVVFDEGLPKVTGSLAVVARPVALVGLGDQGGNLTLVTAGVLLDVKGETAVKGGPLHIVRQADLVFAPDGAGGWKVTAYDMVVTRRGAGVDTTTTTTGAAK